MSVWLNSSSLPTHILMYHMAFHPIFKCLKKLEAGVHLSSPSSRGGGIVDLWTSQDVNYLLFLGEQMDLFRVGCFFPVVYIVKNVCQLYFFGIGGLQLEPAAATLARRIGRPCCFSMLFIFAWMMETTSVYRFNTLRWEVDDQFYFFNFSVSIATENGWLEDYFPLHLVPIFRASC